MKYSKTGMHLTEGFEGFESKSYQDTGGTWTIAYGHTRGVLPDMVCTQLQGYAWLLDDLCHSESDVNYLVCVPLTQDQFDALVDFDFNLGVGNFEHSTLLLLLNEGNFEGAAREFDKWDRCGGRIIAGLLRRRQQETIEFTQTPNQTA
jgi:lysozyme